MIYDHLTKEEVTSYYFYKFEVSDIKPKLIEVDV